MNKSKYFENEINLIQSEDYRMFVRHYRDSYCPSYFWEIGASSSGKFHPQFSQGEGGLVRHTKAVVMFAEELLRMSSYMYMSEEHKDYVIMACILHDTCKYGTKDFNKEYYKDHARNAVSLVNEAWVRYFETAPSEFFLSAIRCHMGQWSEREDRPFTNIDRCVHMADYMASRSFIDIPQVREEWEMVRLEKTAPENSEPQNYIIEFNKTIVNGQGCEAVYDYEVKHETIKAKNRQEAFKKAENIQIKNYSDYNIGSIILQ